MMIPMLTTKVYRPEIRQRFEQLRDELIGSDFHSLMQRYVGMDLVEDLLIEDKRRSR